jgi:hypothetical protein
VRYDQLLEEPLYATRIGVPMLAIVLLIAPAPELELRHVVELIRNGDRTQRFGFRASPSTLPDTVMLEKLSDDLVL